MGMRNKLLTLGLVTIVAATPTLSVGQFISKDPGVRPGATGAGAMLPGLTPNQQKYFQAGAEVFAEVSKLQNGLGPRFNLDSCGGCHSQPALGGTSPAVNPQIAVATAYGARNTIPSFLTLDSPVREVRFKRHPDGTPDGGVHALFVISGRLDDGGL